MGKNRSAHYTRYTLARAPRDTPPFLQNQLHDSENIKSACNFSPLQSMSECGFKIPTFIFSALALLQLIVVKGAARNSIHKLNPRPPNSRALE